jgi:hypothetical protein
MMAAPRADRICLKFFRSTFVGRNARRNNALVVGMNSKGGWFGMLSGGVGTSWCLSCRTDGDTANWCNEREVLATANR